MAVDFMLSKMYIPNICIIALWNSFIVIKAMFVVMLAIICRPPVTKAVFGGQY